MKHFLLFIIAVSLSFTGCFKDDSDSPQIFELTGSWSMTNPVEQTMTFTQTTCNSDKGFKGKIISFNNTENWYIVQPTEGAGGDEGKYSMTKYSLSDDGNTLTGTSYSSEETEEAAKASTTEKYSGMTLKKQ